MRNGLRDGTTDVMAVMLGVVLLAVFMVRNAAFFHDDAYITLRYAQTFAETGLIQWNRGEWTEGYTSLIHVLLTGGLIRAGVPPVAAAQGLNVLAAVALLAFTALAARRIAPEPAQWAVRALSILAVAAAPPIAVWVLGGLEAVIVAALLTGGLAALLSWQQTPRAGPLGLAIVAFGVAVLTRLDASVFVAGAGLGVLLAGPGAPAARLWAAVLVVGVPAAVAFAQMGVRLQIYGEAFPLTFYAKADLPFDQRLSRRLPYLSVGLLAVPALCFAALGAGLALIARRLTRNATLVLCAVILPLAYVVWAGGDHMPAARMLVPLVAPGALLLLALTTGLAPSTRVIVVGAAALAAIVQSAVHPPRLMDNAAFVGGLIGRHIDETWPRGVTIAVNTAGSTPFYAGQERVFIDMLGLNDPVIAKREDVPMHTFGQKWPGHAKGDGAYVLSRAPDRIIVGPAAGVSASAIPWFLTDWELARLPEFAACYREVTELLPYPPEVAALAEPLDNPLIFVYYVRTCS